MEGVLVAWGYTTEGERLLLAWTGERDACGWRVAVLGVTGQAGRRHPGDWRPAVRNGEPGGHRPTAPPMGLGGCVLPESPGWIRLVSDQMENSMRRFGAYEAQTHLPKILDEVAQGEAITITKHGVAIAVRVRSPGRHR